MISLSPSASFTGRFCDAEESFAFAAEQVVAGLTHLEREPPGRIGDRLLGIGVGRVGGGGERDAGGGQRCPVLVYDAARDAYIGRGRIEADKERPSAYGGSGQLTPVRQHYQSYGRPA